MNSRSSGNDDLPPARDVVETCLGAGLGAGLLVWFVLFPLIGRAADLFPNEWVNGGGFGLSASACGVAIVLSAMVMALRWRFAKAMRRPGLLARLTAALVVSALVSTPLLTAFAAYVRYATRSGVLAVEVLMAASVVAVSVTLALRSMRRRPVKV